MVNYTLFDNRLRDISYIQDYSLGTLRELVIRLQKCTSCRNEKNLHGFKYWRYCLCGRTISSHLVRGLEYQAEGMNSIRSVIFKLLLISMCHKLHSIILNLNFKLLRIKAFDRWSRSIIAQYSSRQHVNYISLYRIFMRCKRATFLLLYIVYMYHIFITS